MGPLEVNLWTTRPEPEQSSDSIRVLAFHGFTGTGQDFEGLSHNTSGNWHWFCPDWIGHGDSPRPRILDFYVLPFHLAIIDRSIRKLQPQIVIGYSMGGRLLLHAIARGIVSKPAVIISASPGLSEIKERSLRRERDHQWVDLLEQSSVQHFCKQWTAQPILNTDPPSKFLERSAQRRYHNDPHALAMSLTALGTGQLPGLWESIPDMKGCLWITGRQDDKFISIAQEICARNSLMQQEIIENAGHSPQLSQPSQTARSIENYLKNFR